MANEDKFNWDDYADAPEENVPMENSQFDWNAFQDFEMPPNFVERRDRQGMPGAATDIAEGLYEGIKNLPGAIHDIFKGGGGAIGQLETNPTRLAQNVGGGLANWGNIIGNLPRALNMYQQSRRGTEENEGLTSKLLNLLSLPEQPSAAPITENETTMQRILRSIHLPRPDKFDYAKGLGREDARFPQEAETDAFIQNFIPQTLSYAAGGIPGLMLNELGAERNPYMPLIFPVGKQGLKTAGTLLPKTAPEWLTKGKAGKSVGEPAKALKNELVQGYEEFKTQAREAGIKGNTKELVTKTIESDIIDPNTGKPVTQTITKLESPSMEKIKSELRGVDAHIQESVHKAFESGDIGDLIDAEKDMGTYQNNQWQDFWHSDKPLNRTGLHDAKQMEAKLNKIITEVGEKLDPAEANKILKLRERWHTELRPFLNIEPIDRYVNGKITAEDLTRRLQANTKEAELFRATLAQEYKAIGKNKFKNKLAELGLKGGILSKFMMIVGGG